MNEFETPLQQAARHVAQSKARVANQKALVAEFERDGHLEAAAIGRQILAEMQRHLTLTQDRLERKRRAEPLSARVALDE